MTPKEEPAVHLLIAARRAEDRADVRAGFASRAAWTAEEVATFGEALHRCRAGGISCLLLHLDLPDAGVFEAIAALVRDRTAAGTPVVVLSSHLGDDFCRVLVAAGADDAIGESGLRGGGLVRTVEHAIVRRHAPRWEHAQRDADAAAARRTAGLELLSEGAAELLKTRAPDVVIETLFRRVAGFVGADVFFHFRADPDAADPASLRLVMSDGLDAKSQERFRSLECGQGACGATACERRPRYRPDLQHSDDPASVALRELGLGVYACYPLIVEGDLLGTLCFGSRTRRSFDDDERTLLEATGRHVAAVLDRMRRERADRRAAAELRASEVRARLALRSANLGAWEWSVATDRVAWSPECAPILGVEPGRTPHDFASFAALVEPDDVERLRVVGREWVDEGVTGRTHMVEFRVRGLAGDERWLVAFGSVIVDDRDGALRVVGVLGDVTNRKHAEAEREHLLAAERAARVEADRAGRLKDEFLATISHELRTPLNSILGWARLMLRPGAKPETFGEGIRVIERNAKVQAQLISDLLDVNRIVSGKLLLELADVSLNDVAASALETVQPTARERRVAIETDLGRDLPPVRGDSARLQQVIWNLLSNAIKFTPDGGRVRLATRARDGFIELEVSDTGQGIDPDFLPNVFDRFRQADGSITRQHGGLGLGLAIVKQLVEMHGGSVSANSEGPCRGATFAFRLPSQPAARMAGSAPVDSPLARDSLQGVRVLLVDDQGDALEFTRRLLEEHGAEVATATRAEEALALLRSPGAPPPGLLVSDIGMPGMDGYELLRTVRMELGLGPDRLPAVAVTAYAREDDRLEAHAVGYQMHLTKPFQPDRLIAAVEVLVRPTAPDLRA
jgi:signal transduction histidine kinase/DNA-binding response OmpR family regulator